MFAAEHVQYVVLDEADKMLSLGLQPQLKRIRALVVPRRSKATTEVGAGVLVKPHTRRKRPQVSTITNFRPLILPVISCHCSTWTHRLCLFSLKACWMQLSMLVHTYHHHQGLAFAHKPQPPPPPSPRPPLRGISRHCKASFLLHPVSEVSLVSSLSVRNTFGHLCFDQSSWLSHASSVMGTCHTLFCRYFCSQLRCQKLCRKLLQNGSASLSTSTLPLVRCPSAKPSHRYTHTLLRGHVSVLICFNTCVNSQIYG